MAKSFLAPAKRRSNVNSASVSPCLRGSSLFESKRKKEDGTDRNPSRLGLCVTEGQRRLGHLTAGLAVAGYDRATREGDQTGPGSSRQRNHDRVHAFDFDREVVEIKVAVLAGELVFPEKNVGLFRDACTGQLVSYGNIPGLCV